jgi:hypothetical protein
VLMTNVLIFFTLSLSQIKCMAQGTKITFSEEELEAIARPDFFYIKHAALQKVIDLLGETERTLRNIILPFGQLQSHTDTASPKIFRGENYRLLPYAVLDYPRKFSTETVFAFRTMFWWGKEFSHTLHLQGAACELFKKNIALNVDSLGGKGFYYCVHKSPWQYYFEADNYVALDEMKNDRLKDDLLSKDFIKLSRKTAISDFNRVPEQAAETLGLLLKIIF